MTRRAVTERSETSRALEIRSPAFTGRDRELAALTDALASPGAVVLLEGEAGIGKTRLLREYLAAQDGQTGRPLVAACPPLARPQTLGSIADAIRQGAGGVAGLGLSELAGALRPIFPEWVGDLPPLPEPAEDVTAARHRVFAALAELLAALEVPLLAVEDVHWADEATVEFLLYLASRQPRLLSLVASCRPEDAPRESLLPRLARLAAGESGRRITLGPLDFAETACLVSSMLAGQQITAEFAAFIHQHSEGVPLAAEEMVRLMGERADVTGHGGVCVLDKITVPPTIRDVVLERARRLGPYAQAVLRAAAVLTDPAPPAALAAVALLSADQAGTGLGEAVRSGLLQQDRRGMVSFVHMLAGRSVYVAIPTPQRRVMHLRAGRALEELRPLPLARLAHHFREGGDTDKWCRYAEQAADTAFTAGDDATSSRHLNDLVTGVDLPASEMIRLTKKIVFGTFAGLACTDLVDVLRTVLAGGGLRSREEGGLRFQLGRVLMATGEFEAARGELALAVPHLGNDPVQAAQAMTYLGCAYGANTPRPEHLRWLQQAAQVTLPPGVPPTERLSLAADRVLALLLLGEEAGWALAGQLPDCASTPGERLHLTRCQLNIGEVAMIWGRYAVAERRLARALELAERYPRFEADVLALRACLDWVTGAWHGLAGRVGALADNQDLGPDNRRSVVLVSGLLHTAGGRHEQARECLQRVLAEARRHGALMYLMQPAAALARLHLAAGHVDVALRVTDEPLAIVARKGTWIWATDLAPARVEALAAAGRIDDARTLVAAFARGLGGRDATAPRAGLALCRAILAQARGEHARGSALFAQAAAAWQALPRPYEVLLARERQAGCLLAAGKADTGLALLAEVLRGLSQLGATADAGRVARALRQRGARAHCPGAGRRSYGDRLSPRELAVVRLLVTGQTNAGIARALFLSPKTVERHVESAMRKLNASSRTALAVSAIKLGVVPSDPVKAATR